MRITLALMACLAVFLPALVPASTLAKGTLDCSNAYTQADMNQCAGLAYQEADAALNEAWGQLRERYAEGAVWNANLSAQRIWIEFRDAHCNAEALRFDGGSIQPLIQNSCLQELTEQRTQQLLYLIEQP